MPRKPSTKLTVISTSAVVTGPQPPGNLGPTGSSLWRDIVAAYEFNDRGSYETLYQACSAADRAEKCRAAIDADGEVLKTRGSVRDHPLIKHELANRAFVCRSLARLGLDLEPVRAGPGRPPPGGFV
jgi:hypothetical protein